MLKGCYETWNQSPDCLRKLALNAKHLRTRERFSHYLKSPQAKKRVQAYFIGGQLAASPFLYKNHHRIRKSGGDSISNTV